MNRDWSEKTYNKNSHYRRGEPEMKLLSYAAAPCIWIKDKLAWASTVIQTLCVCEAVISVLLVLCNSSLVILTGKDIYQFHTIEIRTHLLVSLIKHMLNLCLSFAIVWEHSLWGRLHTLYTKVRSVHACNTTGIVKDCMSLIRTWIYDVDHNLVSVRLHRQ